MQDHFSTTACAAKRCRAASLNERDPVASIAQERVLRSELVAVSFFLSFSLCCLNSHLFVILLQSSKIFSRLRELTFFHTFSNIPVDESTFRIHEIELVIDAREHLSDGSRVANHAHRTHDFGKITTWDNGRGLVVDSTLKSCRGPIDELNSTFGLNGGHCCVHILRHHITTIHHTASHVLTMARITLCHHCCGLKGGICDLCNRQLLMVCLLCRDDWCITRKHEVNT